MIYTKGIGRREFCGLAGAAVAAASMPAWAQTASTSDKPVGFAAIGLGTISDIFSRACLHSQKAKITAVVTGHPDTKGKHYAQMYGFPESSIYTYETFDRIRDNKAVDAVYVGLPNSMHREYTERAAQAGKHVFCEKPMAISSAECRQMIAACKKANVKLQIGYRVHYEPTHIQAKKLVQSGSIGDLQSFEGAFGFYAQPNQWRLTRQYAGGGSIMDVGIYPLNEARWITEEEPAEIKAVLSTQDKTSGRFATIEESSNWVMKFPSGVTASMSSSYGANQAGYLRIYGSRGTLELSNAYGYSGVHLRGLGRQGVDVSTPGNDDWGQFLLEADHFADCIRTGAESKTPGEEGLKDLLAIEALYKSAGAPIA